MKIEGLTKRHREILLRALEHEYRAIEDRLESCRSMAGHPDVYPQIIIEHCDDLYAVKELYQLVARNVQS